jgi:hypothetical protein
MLLEKLARTQEGDRVMNWIKGRPDDWTKETDNDCPVFSDSTGDPIVCSQRPNDYEAGASAMLAARDKWWVDRLILAERKCRDLVCEHYRECDCIDSFGGNYCIWWQQLKKELEENNG